MSIEDTSIVHGDTSCPLHNEPVLPDEDGNCSLCGYAFDNSVHFIIDNERSQAWNDGREAGLKEQTTGEYPVLGVSLSDYINSFGQADGEYDEEMRELMEVVETMDVGEWQFVASLVADELWDGDKYDNALWNAVQKVRTYRGEMAEART